LPEPEQEQLIDTLSTSNTKSNNLYKQVFLALPLFSTLLYTPLLFQGSTAVLSLLSISSLLSSAYILYVLPPGVTGLSFLDAYIKPDSPKQSGAQSSAYKLPQLGQKIDKSPIEIYLPYLNLILSGLVLFGSFMAAGSTGGGGLSLALGSLPAVMFGIVLGVKVLLGSVDVGELEKLKYGYKGA
jgi:hypothetical protein